MVQKWSDAKVYAIAGASLIALEICEAIFPSWTFLPIGGEHIAQIGVVFGTAFVLNELRKVRS
jgi:hypothetical protein